MGDVTSHTNYFMCDDAYRSLDILYMLMSTSHASIKTSSDIKNQIIMCNNLLWMKYYCYSSNNYGYYIICVGNDNDCNSKSMISVCNNNNIFHSTTSDAVTTSSSNYYSPFIISPCSDSFSLHRKLNEYDDNDHRNSGASSLTTYFTNPTPAPIFTILNVTLFALNNYYIDIF